MRLLAAANDDAVLASWAAVFDEYKMSPECDVSPYDCWEVLQGFLSSGVLSPLEYNNVNLKAAFFSGTRPTTGQIQEVLCRLKYLRSSQSFEKDVPMSGARPPLSAFTNQTAISTREENRSLGAPPQRSGLSAPRANPGLSAFQVRQESIVDPHSFRPIAEPPAVKAFGGGAPAERDALQCRKVDATLYRGLGEFNVQVLCCGIEMQLEDSGVDESYEGESEEGVEGIIHEYMFHSRCDSCGKRFHTSMSQRVPDEGY